MKRGLYKSKSGAENYFYYFGVVEYIRRKKPPIHLALYHPLGIYSVGVVIAARLLAIALKGGDFKIVAKRPEDFDEIAEQVAEDTAAVDQGTAAAVRTVQALQGELSGGSASGVEVPQQSPAPQRPPALDLITDLGIFYELLRRMGGRMKKEETGATTFLGVTDGPLLGSWSFNRDGKFLGRR